MKVYTRILLIAFVVALLVSCQAENNGEVKTIAGSGNVVTESREVSGFTAVTLQGLGQVIIDQTGSESLTISADDNLLPYIKTEVRGDTLIIGTTEPVLFTNMSDLTFQITANALDSVTISGAGSLKVNDLDTEKWSVEIPGAGNVTVSGRTSEQTVKIEGAGNYAAEDLASQKATIRSSGAGIAVVRVSDLLDVTIEGLGSVEYIGNPTVKEQINGLGSVKQRP